MLIDIRKRGVDSLSFTLRERQILELVCHNRGNKEIAQDLGISQSTVKKHITGLLRKIGVHDRAAAFIWVMQHPEAVTVGFTRTPALHPSGCPCGGAYCVTMRRIDSEDPGGLRVA